MTVLTHSPLGVHDRKDISSGPISLVDEDQGIVEAIVSVTNVLDDVNDIILPGAYKATLANRVPKCVWAHNWEEPVAKTLEIEELMPGDPRLPASIQALGGGGLLVRAQFNMGTQRGRDAFADVKFFGDHSEWSIGYLVPAGASTIDQKTGIRKIKSLELFEYSPVLFGANAHTVTMSVKKAIGSHKTDTSDGTWDGSAQKANLSNDAGASVYRKAYAWVDPKADADTKTAYKFIHHFVSGGGEVGAASTKACSTGIGVLHGGRQGTTIPDADRRGVYQHLAAHMKDAGMEPPAFKEWETGLEEEKSMDPETEHLFIGFLRLPDLCSSCGHERTEEFHLSAEDLLDEEIKVAIKGTSYEVRKDGDEYCVVDRDTNEKVSDDGYATRSEAVESMRALYATAPEVDQTKASGDPEEEGPHDYVPSEGGDDGSPCDVCGLPMDASIHDGSKSAEKESAPVGDKSGSVTASAEEPEVLVPVEEEKALVEPAEEPDVQAASEADDAEEKATGTTDTLPADVVRAIQDIDTILDAMMTKYGVDDQDEPDADDSADASKVFRLPTGAELNLAIDPEVTGLVMRRAASGQIYIEGMKGEEKTDPFFPHVFESGGEAGMCALCGTAKDSNIHIPFPIGEQDPLNPRQPAPGSARLPDNPTAGGPLDPVKPTPGSARNPDNPTPGGPLDAPLPAKTAEEETAIKVGTIEANEITFSTLDVGETTDTKVNVPLVGSFEDLQNQIQASLGSNLPTPVQDGDEQCAWVEATFPDSVLVAVVEYSTGADNDDDAGTDVDGDWEMEFIGLRYFRYPYTAAEGALSLGSPEEVDVRGVIAPKAAEPEGLITKTVAAIEAKAGRTLSGSNADKIRQAVQTLIEVLSVAGVDVSSEKDADESEVEEKAGIPAHLLMQNDLLRMLADR